MNDPHDIEHEIFRLSAAIDSLCDAKEVMEAFGVPFTAKQMRMLDWYMERKQDLERFLPELGEEYDDLNPEHAAVDTRLDGEVIDLVSAMLRRKDGKLH